MAGLPRVGDIYSRAMVGANAIYLLELGLLTVRRRPQRVNSPSLRSLGWRIRITPVGPDVQIRNTGPPGTGADNDSSWTRPDPPTICTATPSGTRTSIEPHVSRQRLTRCESQLEVVRSS